MDGKREMSRWNYKAIRNMATPGKTIPNMASIAVYRYIDGIKVAGDILSSLYSDITIHRYSLEIIAVFSLSKNNK